MAENGLSDPSPLPRRTNLEASKQSYLFAENLSKAKLFKIDYLNSSE